MARMLAPSREMAGLGTLLVLSFAALAGCAPTRTYFVPTETLARRPGGQAVRTFKMVPVETGQSRLYMHIEARAYLDAVGEVASFPTLQFRYWVHNDAEVPLELRLGTFQATDQSGQPFVFSRGRYEDQITSIVIIPPRTRSFCDVYFRLPEGYDVLSPTHVSLEWSLRVGEHEYTQTTRFERAADRPFHNPFLSLPMGL